MTSPAMAKAKGQTLRLSGQIVDLVEPGRLPQPERERERESFDANPDNTGLQRFQRDGGEASPRGQRHVEQGFSSPLFPTPVASEGMKATNRQTAEQKGRTGQVWLTNVAQSIREANE